MKAMENGKQPAFARPAFSDGMGEFHAEQTGLTKREYFAAMAMQGMAPTYMSSSVPVDEVMEQPKKCAQWAVIFADELLKALETNQTKQ